MNKPNDIHCCFNKKINLDATKNQRKRLPWETRYRNRYFRIRRVDRLTLLSENSLLFNAPAGGDIKSLFIFFYWAVPNTLKRPCAKPPIFFLQPILKPPMSLWRSITERNEKKRNTIFNIKTKRILFLSLVCGKPEKKSHQSVTLYVNNV